MRTLQTGKQGTPVLCPAKRAFFLFFNFIFLGGVHFFSKNNNKIFYFLSVFPLFFLCFSLSFSVVHTLWVLLSLMNFTKVRCEGKLKNGVAYKL
jgi:hypothetical protein